MKKIGFIIAFGIIYLMIGSKVYEIENYPLKLVALILFFFIPFLYHWYRLF